MDPFTTIIRGLIGAKAAEKAANNETVKNIGRGVEEGANMVGQGIYNTAKGAIDWVGETANKAKDKAAKVLSDATKAGEDAFNGALDGYLKLFGLGYKDGQIYSPEVEKTIQKLSEEAKKNKVDSETLSEVVKAVEETNNSSDTTAKEEKPVEEESSEDVITYTYKPGDTFGRVLVNLGLSDGSNLWGPGGDVDFYTQQLRDQDMLDFNGNVKLGVPFKLRRRK